jgi:hypothetical protein
MSARDPKTDPRPGDILRAGAWLFDVQWVTDVWVLTLRTSARTGEPGPRPEWNLDRVSWLAKMAAARVIAMGVPGATR